MSDIGVCILGYYALRVSPHDLSGCTSHVKLSMKNDVYIPSLFHVSCYFVYLPDGKQSYRKCGLYVNAASTLTVRNYIDREIPWCCHLMVRGMIYFF